MTPTREVRWASPSLAGTPRGCPVPDGAEGPRCSVGFSVGQAEPSARDLPAERLVWGGPASWGGLGCSRAWIRSHPHLLLQVEPPELPADLQHWIAYNEASSQLLRAECGLHDVLKDQ